MHIIIKFRVYCITEQIWVESWTDQENITVCPNNNTHEINESSIQEVSRTYENEVKIIQEGTETGGNFTIESYEMNIQANEIASMDISWEFPVSVKVIYIIPDARYPNNTITGVVAPMTIIGATTSDAEIGAKTVAVTDTVTENILVGYQCFIGGEYVGKVIGVDKDLNVITFSSALQAPKLANSIVQFQILVVENLPVGIVYPGNVIGNNNLSSKYIPLGMKIRCTYTNLYPVDIIFKFCIEYLY